MAEAAGPTVTVRVPATAANLGPGFDSCGLALGWYDTISAGEITEGLEVVLSGEGADTLPRDESHLVVQCIRRGLAELDHRVGGLRLEAHNTIPHGKGLGSSASAIVAGLALAWGIARPGRDLDLDWLVQISSELEGHPDNSSAAVLGGFTLAWDQTRVPGARAVSLPVVAPVGALALVPDAILPTHAARGMLPAEVPHADAARTAGRAALLCLALTQRADLLWDATEEWLHQRQRASRMPESYDLLTALRADGHAAVIAGAGPTVLVLGPRSELETLADDQHPGFRPVLLEIGEGVTLRDRSTD